MDPLKIDLIWRRNAPEPESFTIYGDNGLAMDITGMSMKLQVRLYAGAPGAALVSLGIAAAGQPGIFIDDAAGGVFTITPPLSATLLGLPIAGDNRGPTRLPYDLILIHPDGMSEPFFEGCAVLPVGVTI